MGGRPYYSIATRHHGDLHRGDPRDSGLAVAGEGAIGVVLDEDADTIDKAEGAEKGAPAAEDDEPGLEAAVGEVGRVGAAGGGRGGGRGLRRRQGSGLGPLEFMRRHRAPLLHVGLDDVRRVRPYVRLRLLLRRRDAPELRRRWPGRLPWWVWGGFLHIGIDVTRLVSLIPYGGGRPRLRPRHVPVFTIEAVNGGWVYEIFLFLAALLLFLSTLGPSRSVGQLRKPCCRGPLAPSYRNDYDGKGVSTRTERLDGVITKGRKKAALCT